MRSRCHTLDNLHSGYPVHENPINRQSKKNRSRQEAIYSIEISSIWGLNFSLVFRQAMRDLRVLSVYPCVLCGKTSMQKAIYWGATIHGISTRAEECGKL